MTPKKKRVDEIEAVIQDVCGVNSQIAPRLRRKLRALVRKAYWLDRPEHAGTKRAVELYEWSFKDIFGVKP